MDRMAQLEMVCPGKRSYCVAFGSTSTAGFLIKIEASWGKSCQSNSYKSCLLCTMDLRKGHSHSLFLQRREACLFASFDTCRTDWMMDNKWPRLTIWSVTIHRCAMRVDFIGKPHIVQCIWRVIKWKRWELGQDKQTSLNRLVKMKDSDLPDHAGRQCCVHKSLETIETKNVRLYEENWKQIGPWVAGFGVKVSQNVATNVTTLKSKCLIVLKG